MRLLSLLARPARPAPTRRTRLGLEQLGDRAMPSGFDPEPPILGDPRNGGGITVAPVITDFTAREVAAGVYEFVGRVSGIANVSGLTITFGGHAAMQGVTAVTQSDGIFFIEVNVGMNSGTVTAQTTANGQASNIAEVYITPGA